jgi:hypothetical protein
VLRVGHHIYQPVVLGGVGSFLELDVKAIRLIRAVDPIDSDPAQGDQPRNVDAYHGGQVADELASLVSLALGIRLDNGGLIRGILRWKVTLTATPSATSIRTTDRVVEPVRVRPPHTAS